MLFTKTDQGWDWWLSWALLVLLDIINSVKRKKTQTVIKLKNDRDQPGFESCYVNIIEEVLNIRPVNEKKKKERNFAKLGINFIFRRLMKLERAVGVRMAE